PQERQWLGPRTESWWRPLTEPRRPVGRERGPDSRASPTRIGGVNDISGRGLTTEAQRGRAAISSLEKRCPEPRKESDQTLSFPRPGAPMRTFLPPSALRAGGALSGSARLVLRGRLPQLYAPQGMTCYAAANHVRSLDFKAHAKEVTRQVLAASLVQAAKADGRFQYLKSSQTSKERAARAILQRHPTPEGLVAVLQCVE